MKKPSDYKKYDKVLVVNEIELEQLIEYYNQTENNNNITNNNNNLNKKDIKELANHIVTIIWVPNKNELKSWDGKIVIKNELNKVYSIPFAAIIELTEGIVEEYDDNDNNNNNSNINKQKSNNVYVVRDKDSENNLVQQLAAETIQSTYRRYRECKPAIKLKRVTSEERLVMEMAADTIKHGLRTIVKRKKRSRQQNGRPPLPNDLDQPYSMSNISSNSSQYSVHSSDNIYFDQSPRISSPKNITAPELRSRTPPNFSNKQSLILLTITLIKAIQLKSVKWNGKNDPYVILSLGNNWKHETEVIWNAPEPAQWNVNIQVGTNISNYTGINHSSNKETGEISLEVYSANLVREDQLIGIGKFSLDELQLNTKQEINVSLINDNNPTKTPVASGMLIINLSVNETNDISKYQNENIYERNKHHQDKDDIRQQSRNINGTKVNSKSSPSKLNNNNIAEEKNDNNNNSSNNNGSKKVRLSDEEKIVKIEKDFKDGSKKVEKAEEKKKSDSQKNREKMNKSINLNDNYNYNDNHNDDDDKDITPHPPPPKPVRPTSAPSKRVESTKNNNNIVNNNTERISAWEDNKQAPEKNKSRENIQSKHQHKSSMDESSDDNDNNNDSERKSRKIKEKKKNHIKSNNKKIVNGSLIENFICFDLNEIDISPDLHRRMVDQALETAIFEECSSITLHYQEAALVLDALNIPLIEGVLHPSTSYNIDVESSEHSTVSKSSKSTVILSLQNPALMAASLTEYCREKNLVDLQKYNVRQFSITQSQSITAIKQLILLIYGPWKKVRKIILTASDTNISFGGGRPGYWTSKWIEKISTSLKFPPNKFDDYNGEDFMFLDDQHIGHLLKSSILRARCRLYVKILNLLDTWWDKGLRPKDITKENVTTLLETSESISPTNKKKNNNNSNSNNNNNNKSKLIQFSDGDIVKIISSSNKLLESYLPIQRAYAWKTTSEDLTILTELVGGCVGLISKRSSYGTNRLEINGMCWIEFRDDLLALISKDHIFNMLRNYDGKIEPVSGRCVLVPISCIQSYTPPSPSSLALKLSGKKEIKEKLLSSIPIEEITNGMLVRVQPLEILSRAYERYDWWDRPSVSVLQNISGKLGTIISSTSTIETKRVGVSIKGPNSIEIIDALPLEALIFLPSGEEKEEEKGENNKKKSNSGKEKEKNYVKSKKEINKPTQIVNENIVNSTNEILKKQSKEAWSKDRKSSTTSEPIKRSNSNNNNHNQNQKNTSKSGGNVFFGNIDNIQNGKSNNNNNIKINGKDNNNNKNKNDNDNYENDFEYDDNQDLAPEFIGGGDESGVPDDIDLRDVMIKDLRIFEAPKPISSIQLNSSSRPLYRPVTTKNLTTPNTIDSPNEESNIEPPKYDWMRRSLQPDPRINLSLDKDIQTLPLKNTNTTNTTSATTAANSTLQNNQNIVKPKLSTTTLEIDSSIQRSYGLHDGKTQTERNLNDLTSKITKSKTKTATSRDLQQSKKQGVNNNNNNNNNNNSNNNSSNNNDTNERKTVSISEFDFVIGGTSLGVGLDTQRPQTSSSSNNLNNNNRNKPNSRPSSAGTTRRPTTSSSFSSGTGARVGSGLGTGTGTSTLDKTKDIIKSSKEAEDVEKINFDERMKRDLKRTEKEIKLKEAALKRQLRKYGVNLDSYDSYHNV